MVKASPLGGECITTKYRMNIRGAIPYFARLSITRQLLAALGVSAIITLRGERYAVGRNYPEPLKRWISVLFVRYRRNQYVGINDDSKRLALFAIPFITACY